MHFLTSIAKYLSAYPAIFGVLLGFSLSQLAICVRDVLSSKRKSRSIRKIIEIEIDYNLDLLTLLRTDIKHLRKIDTLNPKSLSFPIWHRKAFESQLSILSEALDKDKITEIFKFYGDLDKLIATYSKISDLTDSSHQATSSGNEASRSDHPVRSMFDSSSLWHQASTLWDECLEEWKDFEQLIEDMHEKGNPLHRI
jgi:hypothetical protein